MKARTNKLPQSAEDFLSYCRTMKGLSIDTLKSYRSDLNLFFDFLKIHKNKKDITVSTIKKVESKDIHSFMMYLENKEKSCGAFTRSRKTSTLKQYFGYLQNIAKIITINPTYALESPKKPKRIPRYLTLEESKQLLTSMDKTSKNYARDYCIVTLFLNCGMRLSELENIRINNIKGNKLTIIGKGDKERTAYLNNASLYALSQYMNVRDTYNFRDEDLLFSIRKGAIEVLVKKNIVDADIKNGDKYSPHKLRHTSATLMYKYGKTDIKKLQQILGHADISTTSIYTHVDDEDCMEAVNNNPLNNL